MKHKWTKEEQFLFSTQKLRSNKIPSKKHVLSKNYCRSPYRYPIE